MTPTREGWYWFLPDANCPTPTGLLRIDRPVVLLIGMETYTQPPQLVVRFSMATVPVTLMSGDWEPIEAPERMQQLAMKRRFSIDNKS